MPGRVPSIHTTARIAAMCGPSVEPGNDEMEGARGRFPRSHHHMAGAAAAFDGGGDQPVYLQAEAQHLQQA
jgi:hypothetical protein